MVLMDNAPPAQNFRGNFVGNKGGCDSTHSDNYVFGKISSRYFHRRRHIARHFCTPTLAVVEKISYSY